MKSQKSQPDLATKQQKSQGTMLQTKHLTLSSNGAFLCLRNSMELQEEHKPQSETTGAEILPTFITYRILGRLHDLDGSHCVGTLKGSEEIINVKASSTITSSWCWRPSTDVSPTCRETEDFKCISHEIKRCLLLGKKAIFNLDSILKSRDITLLTKVHIV